MLFVFCDSNEIRTHNHLVRKRTLNHLAKLVCDLCLIYVEFDVIFINFITFE